VSNYLPQPGHVALVIDVKKAKLSLFIMSISAEDNSAPFLKSSVNTVGSGYIFFLR
jgi:hypothetical protein